MLCRRFPQKELAPIWGMKEMNLKVWMLSFLGEKRSNINQLWKERTQLLSH